MNGMSKMQMWKRMFGKLFGKKKTKAPKNGKWKEFNKHAVLISEGMYQDDLRHGVWKQYYETGELLIEETYQYGVLHGRFASFHLSGRLLSEGRYQHGLREGYFHIFDESGRQVKSMLFARNTLVEEVEVPGHRASPSLVTSH